MDLMVDQGHVVPFVMAIQQKFVVQAIRTPFIPLDVRVTLNIKFLILEHAS
jgi:hypothetical protein